MLGFETLINANRQLESDAADERAARGNRRRLQVFLLVFLASLAIGLAYTYSRPAEYRAQATIAVKTGAVVRSLPVVAEPGSATVTTTPGPGNGASLQAEAGVLSSRPLIEAALPALRQQGVDLSEFGPDPVQGIQAALVAEPVAETSYIALTATGLSPEHLAVIVNVLIDVYSRQLIDGYNRTATTAIDSLRQELVSLDQRLAEKREALEDYRQSADIVSIERDENQILARVKGLSVSLNQANEKVAEAEGRVRSLRASLAAGKAVVRARDNPTLAALESRASQLRESLREQERTYTVQFMDMDPATRGARSRLAELEKQIVEQRGTMGQTALAEAEDELASARQVQDRLQKQLAEDRGAVHAFSRRFSAFKSMQEELAQMESGRRGLSERLLRTETSEKSRMPSVQVIEPATAPSEVWRPHYTLDAGISLGMAFALGLMGIGVVEVFNRPPVQSTAPVILPIAMGHDLPLVLEGREAQGRLPRFAAAPAQLPAALSAARELEQAEVAELLQAMHEDDRNWAGLLLCGATPDEIRRIAAPDLDTASGAIRLHGPSARTLTVPVSMFARLAAESAKPEGPGAAGIAMPDADEECKRRLLCAAHDAGLDDPAEITPQTLRHTCIAYLVRQGLRFSELEHIVGTLPADVLAQYAGLSPAGKRRTLAQVAPLMPGLTGRVQG
ncbi:MAG: hypothetical protein Q7J47_18265 [Azoarcus sp.]|nr:hypothetical protein [Azoarcus sp.]